MSTGVGQFRTASTLVGYMLIPLADTICPRNSTCQGATNSHLASLAAGYQGVLEQNLEDNADVLQMFSSVAAVDQDVVDEDLHEVQVSKEPSDEPLEDAGAVGESHWHTHPLVVAEGRLEGCLVHARLVDAELPEPCEEIYLGENCGCPELVEQVLCQGNWELVLDDLLVESSEVHAEAEPSVLLGVKRTGVQ
eukprot:3117863-Rhodomonas_salina.1